MKSYDKTLTRLILILTKLSSNELPTIKELAEEFGVGVKTIQRDVYTRLGYFPIEKRKDQKLQFIDGFSLDRSSLQNSEMMLVYLALSMVKHNAPDINQIADRTIAKLSTPMFSSPYYVEKEFFETFDPKKEPAHSVLEAIEKQRIATLVVDSTSYVVEPYKIASFDHLWYLFARDIQCGKIKTYPLRKIKKCRVSQQSFTPSSDLEAVLENVHSGFFEDGNTFEVVVSVDAEIAEEFMARKHLSTQKNLEQKDDGSCVVSFEVSHDEDVDNLIKSWLPHVEVLEPARLRDKIHNELEDYLERLQNYLSVKSSIE